MTYETTIAGLSPSFRWKLDGSTAEEGGHSTLSSGTISWSASIIPNVSGQCWQSNGSARINPGNSSQINTDSISQRRSISLWVEFDSVSGTAARCVYEEGGGTHGWGLIQYGSDLVFNMTQSGQSRAHAVHTGLATDTPYHILAVFDLTDQSGSDNMWLYVNGVLSDSALFDRQNFLNSHGGDVQIGQTHDGRDPSGYSGSDANFAGRIQDVCYWSEVELTAANATAIHTAGTVQPARLNPARMGTLTVGVGLR